MATVDASQYTLVPYIVYRDLGSKLDFLLNGGVLLIKKFEQKQDSDVLIRLEDKKFTVSQISYDLVDNVNDPRYWITFNVGINDLSLYTAYQFEEGIFTLGQKYMINDVVNYISEDGAADSAVIEEVYQSNIDPNQFAYKLSRDPNGLYAEEDLIQNIYS
jgi:hypothetical protein